MNINAVSVKLLGESLQGRDSLKIKVPADYDETRPGPPLDWEYDPEDWVDCRAWQMACPNFYVDGIPYAKRRWHFAFDQDEAGYFIMPSGDARRLLLEGGPVVRADPEDTEEVFRLYYGLRKRLVDPTPSRQGELDLPAEPSS